MKNQKGFSAVEALLVLILLGIVGIAGWYVWQANDSSNDSRQKKAPSESVSEKEAAKVEPADYTGWEAYTSTLGKFSMRYPADWQIYRFQGGNADFTHGEETTIRFESPNNFGLSIDIDSDYAPLHVDQTKSWYEFAKDSNTATQLRNDITVWTQKQQIIVDDKEKAIDCPEIRVASDIGFGHTLTNGSIISASGGFCWSERSTPPSSYTVQLASLDYKQALQILESIRPE